MTQDLSVWALILNASIVVKGVLLLLILRARRLWQKEGDQ